MSIEKAYYWPAWLAESCRDNKATKQQKKYFGSAQLCLWRALNIYDDFLDNSGAPKDLPVANRYLRRFLKIMYSSDLSDNCLNWAEKTLFNLERANRKEVMEKKLIIKNGLLIIPKKLSNFNKLINLSEKSLPLAIAPVAILEKGGSVFNAQDLKKINLFFQYALAAKQLADDASDWLDDLKQGQITAVNVLILKAARIKKIKINLEKNPEIAHLLFAEAAAEKTCLNILRLCQNARRQAKIIGLMKNAPIILNLLKPLEKSSQKALNFKKML